MIKNLITSVVLAASIGIQNTTVQNSKSTTTNIQTAPVPITNLVYDNDNLQQGTYYYIKQFESDMPLTYASVKGKGYQKTYVDTVNDIVYQRITYIFRFQYDMPQTMTFNNMEVHLLGQANTTTYDAYYEDYYLYELTQTNATIDYFLDNNQLTYQNMQQLENVSMTQLNTDYINTVGYNTLITINNEYKYIKFTINMQFSGYDTAEDVIISQLISATQPVYRTCTSTFTWNAQTDTTTYEVVDIPGLMFTILGMPFAWISTAFNFTFFPGTPYAVNVSHIILVIVASLILIVVVKRILK